MDFSAFDTKKMDEYAKQAKNQWGKTAEYKEFEEKNKGRTQEEDQALMTEFMGLFKKFGELKAQGAAPSSEEAKALAKSTQDFISQHFYTCSDQILAALSKMYSGGGSMNENIDQMGGPGTGVFAAEAIEAYLAEK